MYIADLNLTITPSSALYTSPVPDAAMTVNESTVQGRHAVILDFNDSEGLYTRDLGTIFQWPTGAGTILDVWQPSIISTEDDLYNRLSYHFEMSALGLTGWGSIREINLAHNATADLTLLLTFDQWPPVTLTIPNSGGETMKVKVIVPANKFKMAEGWVSSPQPFMLWGESCQVKLGQWGRSDPFRVLKPFAG